MEGCGNFGVTLVDTALDGRLEVLYYEIQTKKKGSDRFDVVSECFRANGIAGCKQLATVWLNQTVQSVDWS